MATYNSSSISRGDPARIGVYPVTTVGAIALGNVTLTVNDLLPICYIPQGSFIKSLLINFPILNPSGSTLAMSLVDTLATPTTYISASTSGSNFSALTTLSTANFTNATFGTQYGNTARSLGASGTQVVVWTPSSGVTPPGVLLELKVTATATAATGGAVNITYMVEFAPTYDMGI